MRISKTNRKKEKEPAKKPNAQIIKDIVLSEGIISAIGDGIRILDRAFMVLYDNQVHKNMMGDHIGEYCYQAYKKQKSICNGCPVELVFKDRTIHTVQRELQTDKGIRYLEITASPLKDKTGEIVAGIEIIRDITKRKQAEDAVTESEWKLKNIIEHSNELYYTHNTHHVLSYASPQSLQILGYTPDEMKIEWTRLATDNPINEKGIEITEKAMKTGEKQPPYVLELFKKDRTKVLLEIDEAPVKDDKGNVIGIVGAARDVTECKQTEIALRYSEERYRSTIDALADALHVCDKNINIILTNKTLLEWHQRFGLEEDVIGKNVYRVYSFLPETVREEYESVFKTGTPITTEESIQIHGKKVITETKKIPVFEKSNVIKVITIMRDITLRKKAEEEMNRNKEELRKQVRELEEFYNMAVGRELRMKQLKEENEELKEELLKYKKS
jgi:PAS domain S-box-containing protein